MRLKRIRLNGFKSFCDDTIFDFKENGITTIVGPNGCGKSNIVDALRWVLGEQSPRQLRGTTMTDVIFAGSVSRDPVNRCEVSLLFDNSDGQSPEQYREFSEIAVTRRLYRSGDSDYLINKIPCRLLDIRDLVMDTGGSGRSYSIVEQGKVDQFITATPAERRIYMEEAAGIVRYKTRRIAAERKLDQTNNNLNRVRDVLAEIQRQEDSLRGQMEKAKAYLDLKEEVGELSRRLLRVRLERSTKRCAELDTEFAAVRQEGGDLEQKLAIGLTALERLGIDLSAMENSLREERGRTYRQEREITSNEQQLALAQQNQVNSRRWIEETTRNREELNTRLQNLTAQLGTHREEAGKAAQEAETVSESIDQLNQRYTAKEALRAQLEQRLREIQEGLMECHASVTGINNQRQMLQERIAEAERRVAGMSGQNEATRDELQQTQQNLERQQSEQDILTQAVKDSEAEHARHSAIAAELETEAEELAGRLDKLDRECISYRSRLDSLLDIQASYEGFGESVRNALKWIDESPGMRDEYGIVGPLADVISLPPEAVEWAGSYLGPFLEILLINETAQIPPLQTALSEAGHGGIRLWALDTPLNGTGNGHGPSNGNGGAGNGGAGNGSGVNTAADDGADLFSDLLSVPGDYEPVRSGLFGAVHLTEGSALPLPMTRGDASTGGEWLARDGAYHIDPKRIFTVGGAAAPSIGILRRRTEIDSLTTHLQEAEQAQRAALDEKEALSGRQAEVAQSIKVLETNRNEQIVRMSRQETELEHLAREQARLTHVVGAQAAELEQLTQDQAGYRSRIQELQTDENTWQQKLTEYEGELGGLREQADAATADTNRLGAELTESKVTLGQLESRAEHAQARTSALESDSIDAQRRLENFAQELENQERQVGDFAREIETLRATLLSQQSSLAELQKQVQQRQVVYDKQIEERDRKIAQTSTDKKQVDGINSRMHELELNLAQEQMRREQWLQQLQAEEETGEPEIEQDTVDEAALEKRLDATRLRMERMSGVNLAAWEEYESLNTRAETMLQQREDLEQAIADLKASIRQMNQESRRRFKETFDLVNEQFQRLFPEVFSGGEAKLILTDEEDLLLAGVDIVAQPPGKKLQRLNLLSGGEKALTAIAMIFAFFLTKPSPYCFLDEVDAPLDDVNVGRFNRLVKSMTDRSQFIMITHNKRTMEIGDVLYGVTMEEAGISKVVSVDLGNS